MIGVGFIVRVVQLALMLAIGLALLIGFIFIVNKLVQWSTRAIGWTVADFWEFTGISAWLQIMRERRAEKMAARGKK